MGSTWKQKEFPFSMRTSLCTPLQKQKENVQDIISIWFLLGSVLMRIFDFNSGYKSYHFE